LEASGPPLPGCLFKHPVLSPIRRRLGSGDVRSLHDVGWEEKTAVMHLARDHGAARSGALTLTLTSASSVKIGSRSRVKVPESEPSSVVLSFLVLKTFPVPCKVDCCLVLVLEKKHHAGSAPIRPFFRMFIPS
jgi:hypothetical protein